MRSFIILLAFLLTLPVTAQQNFSAPERTVPQNRQQLTQSFAPVVERTAPSVVNVFGKRIPDRSRNVAMDEFMRRYFGEQSPPQRGQSSLGSGVIIDPSGLVMTNHHVIEGMNEVRVVLSDKREFEAQIVLRDPRTDLSVLKLKGQGPFPPIELGDSEKLMVGDLVLAIGNPFGVGQTVTQGIVSALARTQVGVSDYQFFIQTDAAINPGNSGGALVDMQGRLIGINTTIFSRSGGSHGIGFAIPASMVKSVADSARMGSQTVRRPWFGAQLQPVTNEIAESIGLPRPSGALITDLHEKGPAFAAGLQRGDVIIAVDQTAIDDPDAFGYRYALRGLNGEVLLIIQRKGRSLTLPVRLSPPPELPLRDAIKLTNRSPFQGSTILNLSPATADELQLDVYEGVAISEILAGSIAASLGFQKGDVIIAVNNERITSTRVLETLSRIRPRGWQVTIGRSGQAITRIFAGG
jgi:Do/DeqQ family serine protease